MVQTRQKVFRIVSKCPKMSQVVPNCLKMSQNAHFRRIVVRTDLFFLYFFLFYRLSFSSSPSTLAMPSIFLFISHFCFCQSNYILSPLFRSVEILFVLLAIVSKWAPYQFIASLSLPLSLSLSFSLAIGCVAPMTSYGLYTSDSFRIIASTRQELL